MIKDLISIFGIAKPGFGTVIIQTIVYTQGLVSAVLVYGLTCTCENPVNVK